MAPAVVADAAVEHAPTSVLPPSITGTPKPGEMLTASPGVWTEEPASFTYRWETCFPTGACLPRQDSSDSAYVVQPSDAEHQLRLQITASNAIGSGTATSSPLDVERSWHYATGPPRMETVSWSTPGLKPPWATGKALAIGVSSGACGDEERPRIGDVQVQERGPSTALPFPSAVITVSILFPAPTEVVGTVNPGEIGPGCAGVGIGLGRTIKLKRPASPLYIFDGSTTPPRLVVRPDPILHWSLKRVRGPRKIEILVPFHGCLPLFVHAHVVERRGRAVVTAYGERPLYPSRTCSRGHDVQHLTLKLNAPVDNLELLDGSFDPPRPWRAP
ncbi:MAG TPA: hypothetical protein VGI17_01960 [Solirubrobacterales bacterium]